MKKRLIAMAAAVMVTTGMMAGCGSSESSGSSQTSETQNTADTENSVAVQSEQKTYYYVGINHNHPYWYDVHQGFEFATQQFGCKVVKVGPDDFDFTAQAEALEQAITKQPDGIIVPIFDASILPGIKKAKEAGIPVVAIESYMDGAEVDTYIGLDNVDAGRQTAVELINEAGDTGKVVVMGNYTVANTQQKLDGFKSYLEENSSWEILAELDDNVDTSTALETAKTAFNNYKDMTAIVGLDSSSGAGIAGAMEELSMEPGSITVVVHDREVATLENIKSGYINCTLVNKTASMPYYALAVLEQINKYHAEDIPISADNIASDVNPIPSNMYTGVVFVRQDNVDNFLVENMTEIDSDLYE